MLKNLILTSLAGLLLLSSGCSYFLPEPHKIDIQQGNRVSPEDLAKIEIGMSREQVKFVLGTPLLQDAFHQNRWDYLYYLKTGSDEIRRSRVSLYFEEDKLVRIDTSRYQPEQQEKAKQE